MKKVVGLGIATLDYVIEVERFPDESAKVKSTSLSESGGGNCANTLVGISRLGVNRVNTTILTKIGNDSHGDIILQSLKDENVEIEFVNQTAEESCMSVIIVNKPTGSRTIINHQGVNYDDEIVYPDNILDNTSLVYLDGKFRRTAERLASDANSKGIPVVLEADRLELGVEELFQYAQIVIAPESFHDQFSPGSSYETTLQRILENGPKIAVLTLGEKGSILKSGGRIIEVEACPTGVVDTTGAGDAYIAGFIYGALEEWDLERRMKFASVVAAMNCTKPGPREGLPHYDQVVEHVDS